jgi:hypothetical protein
LSLFFTSTVEVGEETWHPRGKALWKHSLPSFVCCGSCCPLLPASAQPGVLGALLLMRLIASCRLHAALRGYVPGAASCNAMAGAYMQQRMLLAPPGLLGHGPLQRNHLDWCICPTTTLPRYRPEVPVLLCVGCRMVHRTNSWLHSPVPLSSSRHVYSFTQKRPHTAPSYPFG